MNFEYEPDPEEQRQRHADEIKAQWHAVLLLSAAYNPRIDPDDPELQLRELTNEDRMVR